MFVKKMKKPNKTYYYFAENKRQENNKIKITLYRRLTVKEEANYLLHDITNPLEPIFDKNGIDILKNQTSEYPLSRDKVTIKTELPKQLLTWIEDIESGKLKNTPTLRPKAFITKVLRPMLNL